ncbi:MAG: enoyl-CoA hydratase/isomerase family protein [Chloroflexi bacterium]|nr:enoyl-CoA hydratase/isomerase family protein [Chloroflexota bacterium]
MAEYANFMEWVVTRDGPVATIKFGVVQKPLKDFIEHHVSLALALEEVRFDDTVRVVVITGRGDGMFELGPLPGEVEPYPKDLMNPATRPGGPSALKGPWSLSQGIERTFAALALMEKPVIARLNGNAYGFAMHVLWGCDIIIAQEDVLLGDNHLALHPTMPWGMTAGDGAFAFLPLFMTPTKLKEFLLLGPSWTAKQMAEMGLINYAVPADQLDAKVNEFVQKFLERPVGPLIRTKRAANKRLIEQMNLTHDYSWLSETLDHWEMAALDFKQQMTLRPDDPNWAFEDLEAEAGLDPQHKR